MFFPTIPQITSEANWSQIINNEIEDLFFEISSQRKTEALLKELRTHDQDSYIHSINVFTLTAQFIQGIETPLEDHKLVLEGALLHDIGKIKISRDLLQKEGKLTPQEFAEVQRHAEYGKNILRANSYPIEIQSYVSRHHERLDATGYPTGKVHLSTGQQLIILADVYDAISSDRPYSKGNSIPTTIEIIKKEFQNKISANIINLLSNVPHNGFRQGNHWRKHI